MPFCGTLYFYQWKVGGVRVGGVRTSCGVTPPEEVLSQHDLDLRWSEAASLFAPGEGGVPSCFFLKPVSFLIYFVMNNSQVVLGS